MHLCALHMFMFAQLAANYPCQISNQLQWFSTTPQAETPATGWLRSRVQNSTCFGHGIATEHAGCVHNPSHKLAVSCMVLVL